MLSLHRCGRFMHWLQDEAQVRNDLAITYQRMSDADACIGVLSPLRHAFIELPLKPTTLHQAPKVP